LFFAKERKRTKIKVCFQKVWNKNENKKREKSLENLLIIFLELTKFF